MLLIIKIWLHFSLDNHEIKNLVYQWQVTGELKTKRPVLIVLVSQIFLNTVEYTFWGRFCKDQQGYQGVIAKYFHKTCLYKNIYDIMLETQVKT